MPPHPLRNFEIPNYFENGKKLKADLSGNSSPKKEDKTYFLNLNGYLQTGLIEDHYMDIKQSITFLILLLFKISH